MSETINNLGAHVEVVRALDGFVTGKLGILTPRKKLWWPSDLLPQFNGKDEKWIGQVRDLQRNASNLPDFVFAVLIGNTVTEEALPSYEAALQRVLGAADRTGRDETGWARWGRGWTAEENRHGDILNKYLDFSGRVDMRSFEITIYNLIRAGFNPQIDYDDPYQAFVYTSFQETATQLAHERMSRIAELYGDPLLSAICKRVSSDEARHASFYSAVMAEIFDKDPNGAMIAFDKMLKTEVVMPGAMMDDRIEIDNKSIRETDLFSAYSKVNDYAGTFTRSDYAKIIDDLSKVWKIGKRDVSGSGQEALDRIVRVRKVVSIEIQRKSRSSNEVSLPSLHFNWLPGKKMDLLQVRRESLLNDLNVQVI